MRLRKYKTNSAHTVISNLHQIKQRNFFQTRSIVYKDQYVQFVYMPHPVSNPLKLPISHTFLQTMYRCSERLRGWDKYRQELCFVANILGLIMINKNEQLPFQLKPIISIRLQLQVNTCHTFGAFLVCIRRWTRFWEGLFKLTFNGTVIFRQPSFSYR